MKYLHRTPRPPADVLRQGAEFFGAHLAPVEEGPARLRFSGSLGRVSLAVEHESHGTLVTVETDQTSRSELDRLAKLFLAQVHAVAHPGHVVRGAY